MSEKLKDTAIDLLLDGVKKKIDDMRDNHKWQELFVNTGHFFINNSDMVTRFESDLYLVFSEDNLKTLAKKLLLKKIQIWKKITRFISAAFQCCR